MKHVAQFAELIRQTGLCLGLFWLAGCTVGPDYEAPDQAEMMGDWATSLAGEAQAEAIEFDADWWQILDDPILSELIVRAVAANPSLEAAQARIDAARALRRESRAPFFPSFNADASRSVDQSSGATDNAANSGSRRTTNLVSVSASWELDFFGGTRRAAEAADARLDSVVESARALRLAVISETARAYVELRGVQKRIAITQRNIDLQSRTLGLIRDLLSAGEATEFDLTRASGQLALTRSRLPDLDAEQSATAHRLSVLLGELPGQLSEAVMQPQDLPELSSPIPVGARSELLRRRPDIRQAERALAAASAEIGVATADRFPRFFLLGDIGRVAASSRDLDLGLANSYSLTQLVSWPVFQGGALRARVEIREAETRQAAAKYESIVLNALADAESALIQYLRKLEARAALASAVSNSARSVELARALFNAGEEDFLAVLNAERELLVAEDQYVLSETDSLLNLVTFYAALGGGWEVFE
jgi:NodT family efflux transporter outer membrane factor (OMF) lipoprotein